MIVLLALIFGKGGVGCAAGWAGRRGRGFVIAIADDGSAVVIVVDVASVGIGIVGIVGIIAGCGVVGADAVLHRRWRLCQRFALAVKIG